MELQRQCRQSDTVARLGGDEFVFLLDDIARAEDAAVVAAKILASLERPVTAAGRELAVATSIGIALYPDHAATADELIKYADRALYTATLLLAAVFLALSVVAALGVGKRTNSGTTP